MDEVVEAAKRANIHSFIASLPMVSQATLTIHCKYVDNRILSWFILALPGIIAQ